jgi:pantetheine-phosphate adenylyltransferase
VDNRVAVYPGSFDPITNGHVDIICRGSQVFDRLVILVAVNREKRNLFTLEERMDLIRQVFHDNLKVEVDSFEGLLMNYVRTRGIQVVIRGLRAVSDFEYEFQMALMNRKIHPGAETFFLAASETYSYVSSRILKEAMSLGGCVDGLAPPMVIEAMGRKFGPRPATLQGNPR